MMNTLLKVFLTLYLIKLGKKRKELYGNKAHLTKAKIHRMATKHLIETIMRQDINIRHLLKSLDY